MPDIGKENDDTTSELKKEEGKSSISPLTAATTSYTMKPPPEYIDAEAGQSLRSNIIRQIE
eukprot:CAMPEP_0194431254 /NCGR_PEP_ID=MMETSP0176-20130528/62047_1 /TAXON_ID=216777 /ORGANISM="Proboscia alata, Strain PI-D3" /LENGTH=60 /DNA_ID=CAMNT_0039246315 /DNA_START=32 /DNA_END=211 /DNA_ORIENTATION=-